MKLTVISIITSVTGINSKNLQKKLWKLEIRRKNWYRSGNITHPQKNNNKKQKEVKERTCRLVDFADPADHWVKIKAMECKGYINYKGLRKGAFGNRRTGRDYPNCSIVKIDQNTEKSPGDLRRLAVAQTPLKYHQITMVWKTLKE